MKKILLIFVFIAVMVLDLSAQNQHVITSKHISIADTSWVFIPAGYALNPAKNYPLVFLLHGWSGSYHQWNDIMNCQEYADKYGFIIVCPDGLYDSWYINSPALKGSRWTDFFFMDLFPFVTNTYRIDKNNVFITGLSMGGHGALYLFEQNPGLFRSAGSLSGVLNLTNSRSNYRISEILGLKKDDSDEEILKAYSVVGNIDKILGSQKAIIFSCGTADPFYGVNNEFRAKCDEKMIKATYISNPGAHDYSYWKSNIGAHFDFFLNQVKMH